MNAYRWVRRLVWLLIFFIGGAALYLGGTLIVVWLGSRPSELKPADAIVVMGAAQYDGRPSPILQGRLDRALELYRDGLAPLIVVTGGKQTGDRVTQAYTGYHYLRLGGVPDEALLLEVDGTSTYTELAATARILRNQNLTTVILVSEGYHSTRLREIASEVGLHAQIGRTNASFGVREILRETVAVAVGEFTGFRRLDAIR